MKKDTRNQAQKPSPKPRDTPTLPTTRLAVVDQDFVIAYTVNARLYVVSIVELSADRKTAKRIMRNDKPGTWCILRDMLLKRHHLPLRKQ